MSWQGNTCIYGSLTCMGDQFISVCKVLDEIKRKFLDGLEVDMESGAIT